jgi:hypothetical protein
MILAAGGLVNQVMANAPVAESLIGVFVAMTLVVTFRRKTPRVIELAVWVGLILVCVVAIAGTRDPQARALTTATLWGVTQVVGMVVDLLKQGVLHWMYETRFVIATWVVLLFGVDALLLALVATRRQAGAGVPETRLREWMLLPLLRPAQPKPAAVSGVDELNRRLNAWGAPAATATLVWSTLFLIWLRDVEIPKGAHVLKNLALSGAAAGATWFTLLLIWLRDVQVPGAARGLKALALRGRPVEAGASAALGPDIVHIDHLAERVAARKAAAMTDKNGSEKHRQGRLAS